MEKLKLRKVTDLLWIGIYKGKRFELIVEDCGNIAVGVISQGLTWS